MIANEMKCHLHPLLYLPKKEGRIRLVRDLAQASSYFVHTSGDICLESDKSLGIFHLSGSTSARWT